MFNNIIRTCTLKSLFISSQLIKQKRYLVINSVLRNEEKQSEKNIEEKPKKEKSLKEEIEGLNTKIKELQANYLLSLADQENLRQRHKREVENAKEFAFQKFAKELLDPIDILSIALDSVPEKYREKSQENEHLYNLYTGVSMTEKELKKTLQRFGIEEDDPIDQVFDPNKHEAVFQAPVPDKKPGTIFVVQKKGYLLKARVLRPAQVGVVADGN